MSATTQLARPLETPITELPSQFESTPLGWAQCHIQGNIIALNPALERMLGGSLTAMPPLFLSDLVDPENHAGGGHLLRELFRGERDSVQFDSSSARLSPRLIRWTAWRVHGAKGEPDCVMALAVDISDRYPAQAQENRDADQRFRQAERLEAVGRLAGGVAHDFNNLLTGVLLYCDLLLAHLEPCHRVRKYAQEIRNAGLQATGLVRQLLAVARPASSEPRLLSLNEIAEGMRNLLVRLIGENIELKLQLDPNLGLVKMDPSQAQQILLNLVLNARDAMPSGGQISVETSNCNVQVLTDPGEGSNRTVLLPCAHFVVADNGGGMDANTRSHLFDAFFTTKTGGKGTGLGLATVHDIVSSNGGLIHVDSAPACGTRITVLLPLVIDAALNFQQFVSPRKNEGALPDREKE